ncbi:MAG: hypothetical protein Q9208_005654 [Pyrenodesmia sp. 3 TL-2023]
MYSKQYGNIAPTYPKFLERKQHYRTLRDDFRDDPRSTLELEAWRKKDSNFDYQLLNRNQKSFIPPGLVGKPSYDGAVRGKTDTFFSVNTPLSPREPIRRLTNQKPKEYATHNAPDLILSETARSYIIGNLASYDSRQYPSAPRDKRPEGQAFAHTLVIPKARVYNIVDPAAAADRCSLLHEMRRHFLDFWARPEGKAKILARTRRALEEQDQKLLLLASSSSSSPSSSNPNTTNNSDYASVRDDIFAHYEAMKPAFERLKEEDFLFGFHCFPENSIGHLHMHVFPHGEAFRQFSTKDYDYKTVPLQAVLEVEKEDGNGDE